MAEEKKYVYDYPRPGLTVDCVIFSPRDGGLAVLLIRRGLEPYRGRWAFPGGFVEQTESLAAAARRELREETGVEVDRLWPIEAFTDPGRDPRGWTISAPFYGLVGDHSCPRCGDDAAEVAWRPVLRPGPLAFDHGKMLAAARRRLSQDIYTGPAARPLLGREFLAADLVACYRLLDPHCPSPRMLLRRLEDAGVISPSDPARQGAQASWRFGRRIRGRG